MADITALKNRIRAAIKANDNQEITGPVLQQTLLDIVDELDLNPELQEAINTEKSARQQADTSLQEAINTEKSARQQADMQLQNAVNAIKENIDNGYVYAGIATPSSTPVSGKVFYIATAAGTYTNFDSQVLTQGINIIHFNGSEWSSQQLIGIDNVPTTGSNSLVNSNGLFETTIAPFSITVKSTNSGGGYFENNGKVEFKALSGVFHYAKIDDLTPYSEANISNCQSYNVYKTFVTDEQDNVLIAFNEWVNTKKIVFSDYPNAKKLYVSSYNASGEPLIKLKGKNYIIDCGASVNGDDFSELFQPGFCAINANNKAEISINNAWDYYCITDVSKYCNIIYDGRVRSGAYQILTDSEDNVLWSSQDNTKHILDITQYPTASKFYFCTEKSQLSNPVLKGLKNSILYEILSNQSGGEPVNVFDKTIYIAPNGNDGNDGLTSSSPKQTVDAALDAGATTILCKFGAHNAIYKQKIDLSKAKHNRLTISPAENVSEVCFVGDNSFVTDTETKENGYTYVYSSNYSGDVSTLVGKELYMYGVPDANTLILDSERHSSQKGRTYRMTDLPLSYVNSINDVDTNSAYRFTVDTNTNKIYFNRPPDVPVNPYHPLFKRCVTDNVQETLFLNNDKVPNLKLTMTHISVKFVTLNINYLINPTLIECSGGYASAYAMGQGSITFHSSVGAELIRCEAYGNAGGDGFSGHTIGGFSYSSATVIDCWAHDNSDDGISTHSGGELSIIGGLFEYNGKAGVTPAVTTQCTCHDVYSRQNYSGFLVLNAGGATVVRNFVCQNCVSENNNRGTYNGTGVNHTGFLAKDENSNMLLINCKSIGDEYGYKAEAGTTMRLIDCSASGNTTIKSGDGTIIINNTSSVS